jgi:hypothetical protein
VNNWKVIFATVVIFSAGVITGGLLVNYVQNTRPKSGHKVASEVRPATNQIVHPAPEAASSRAPQILSKQFLQRLQEKLSLTKDQNEAIQKIIDDGQNQMRKVVFDSRLEIRDVLTPEQQKQFDDQMKRQFRKTLFNTNLPPVLPNITNSPATNVLVK